LGSRAVTGVFAAAFGLCGLFEITGEACWTEEGRMLVVASVEATTAFMGTYAAEILSDLAYPVPFDNDRRA
jgi:hypothetical protein